MDKSWQVCTYLCSSGAFGVYHWTQGRDVVSSLSALAPWKGLNLVLNTDTVFPLNPEAGSNELNPEVFSSRLLLETLRPCANLLWSSYWAAWDGSYRPHVDKLSLRLFNGPFYASSSSCYASHPL